MKTVHHGAWLIIAIILQTLMFNYITVFGVHPNLLLVAALAIAVCGGKIQGMVCGMIFGLVFDFMSGRMLGANMIAFAAAGYITGAIVSRYYAAPPFYIFMAIGAAVTAGVEIICLIPYTAGLEIAAPLLYILKTIIIEAVMNGILIVPAVWCVRRTTKLLKIQNLNTFR